MEVFYNNKLVSNNQFLNVSETQKEPNIKLNVKSNKLYTLIMYDPDAVKGTFIHWLKVNITSNDINTGNIIIHYKGPAPPVHSGIHHYIFELYEQSGENNLENVEQIVSTIDIIKKKMNLNKLVGNIQFRSQNENGGKRKKNKVKTKRTVKCRQKNKFKVTKRLLHH